MSNIEKLLAQLQQEREVFIKEHDQKIKILRQLPSNTLEPTALSLNGYEADYLLEFNCTTTQLEKLLQAYPPVDLVEVWGSSWTIKPKCRLTKHDEMYSDVVDAFNRYIRRGEHLHGTYWWTRLDEALVFIRAIAPKEDLPSLSPDDNVWEEKGMPGGTASYYYFTRKVPNVQGLPAVDAKSPDLVAIKSHIKTSAEQMLYGFLSGYSSFKDDAYPRKCFEVMLRKATGYAVKLVFARCSQSTAFFCIRLNKAIETIDIRVEMNPVKPQLHSQNFPV